MSWGGLISLLTKKSDKGEDNTDAIPHHTRLSDAIVDTLAASGENLTSDQIAERIGEDITAVRGAIQRLEKQGWVRRTQEKRGRYLTYRETEMGRKRQGRGGNRRT